MTNKITEQKFQEAKEYAKRINEISMFNKEIFAVQAVCLNREGNTVYTITNANGTEEELLFAIDAIAEKVAYLLIKDHPCPCSLMKVADAVGNGVTAAIRKAAKEGVTISVQD